MTRPSQLAMPVIAAAAALATLAGARPPAAPAAPAPSPGEIAAAAPAADWVRVAPADLLVMDLAPAAHGAVGRPEPRRVVIQLIPAPSSQGWVGNIRRLAAAHWWDGLSINRVQDDYVVQWGDPAEDAAKARRLPAGLAKVPADAYTWAPDRAWQADIVDRSASRAAGPDRVPVGDDPYVPGGFTFLRQGWPYATDRMQVWPVHCYGTVGVGRDLPPDTGSGAELYAVIGHAPRQLDRNIAVVGRVIDGIEQLSSLPRGTGPLGFYDRPEERVPIVAIRSGDQVPGLPAYAYLSTETASFARYADARANRRDPFYVVPEGGADICNVPVPVRRLAVPAGRARPAPAG